MLYCTTQIEERERKREGNKERAREGEREKKTDYYIYRKKRTEVALKKKHDNDEDFSIPAFTSIV